MSYSILIEENIDQDSTYNGLRLFASAEKEIDVIAYANARMPATYSAVHTAFENSFKYNINNGIEEVTIKSSNDIRLTLPYFIDNSYKMKYNVNCKEEIFLQYN